MEQSRPKTYCEKWPDGCTMCDLLMCNGTMKTAESKIIEKLDSCKFCGGKSEFCHHVKYDESGLNEIERYISIACESCGYRTGMYHRNRIENAVAEWNRRAKK